MLDVVAKAHIDTPFSFSFADAGRALGPRIATDLEQFFGEGWLVQAAPPQSPPRVNRLRGPS